MRTIVCACGKTVTLPESMTDVKCLCGRVYNPYGNFLWDEGAKDKHDRRTAYQDDAVTEAFIEGTLPEKDRRKDADPAFGKLQETVEATAQKPRTRKAKRSEP